MTETLKNHSLKITIGTLIAAILFTISTTAYVFKEKGEMWDKIDTCEVGMGHIIVELDKIDGRVRDNETTGVEVKVKLAAIETQLISVNVSLTEIKNALK